MENHSHWFRRTLTMDNKLTKCVKSYLDSFPDSDENPKEILQQQIYEEFQNKVRDWLDRVSMTKAIEFPFLHQDWQDFLRLSKKTKAPMDDDLNTYTVFTRRKMNTNTETNEFEEEMNMDRTDPSEDMDELLNLLQSEYVENEESFLFDPMKRTKICTKEKPIANKTLGMSSGKIIIRLNHQIARFVHEQTGMVFVSPEEPRVFARWDGENVCALTTDDVELCNLFRFQYTLDRDDLISMYSGWNSTKSSAAAESSSSHDQS